MTNKEMAMHNFDRNLWTEDMVAKLVAKGKITSADYAEITGKPYPEDGEVSAQEALNELQEVLA